MTMTPRPSRKRSASGNVLQLIDTTPMTPGVTPGLPAFDDEAAPPGSMQFTRFTLTSKPNWWLVELKDDNATNGSFDSDDTAVSDPDTSSTPPASATVYKPSRDHPTNLFQFPTPPAYTAPPRPTAHLSAMASGSTSELFKCVVKKPEVVELEINGELQSNISDVRAQFMAELRVYRTVTRHRNIVAFLGCLEGLGMVLEFVDGCPLLDIIRDPARPLDRESKTDYHNQLLSGLAHIHSFGLSHGDLSLLNVHVTQDNILKILDFGRSVASRTFKRPAQPPQMAFHPGAKRHRTSAPQSPREVPGDAEEIHPGTRPFSAPEILRGECKDPLLADAYSFGIILLCVDLGGLIDIDPEHQRKDGAVDTSGCMTFTQRIKWYTAPWRDRRNIRKEDRIR